MANEWILDVLADLNAFAHDNQMPKLARQLALTAIAAKQDMGMDHSNALSAAGQGFEHVGILHRATAECGDAR